MIRRTPYRPTYLSGYPTCSGTSQGHTPTSSGCWEKRGRTYWPLPRWPFLLKDQFPYPGHLHVPYVTSRTLTGDIPTFSRTDARFSRHRILPCSAGSSSPRRRIHLHAGPLSGDGRHGDGGGPALQGSRHPEPSSTWSENEYSLTRPCFDALCLQLAHRPPPGHPAKGTPAGADVKSGPRTTLSPPLYDSNART